MNQLDKKKTIKFRNTQMVTKLINHSEIIITKFLYFVEINSTLSKMLTLINLKYTKILYAFHKCW